MLDAVISLVYIQIFMFISVIFASPDLRVTTSRDRLLASRRSTILALAL